MNSEQLTDAYFDRIVLKARLIGSDLPDTGLSLWGECFETPITTAALSHLRSDKGNGMAEMAAGAKLAGALCFVGMTDDETIEAVLETGARVISIIKPDEDNAKIIRQIEHAKALGAFAVGVDIDHAYADNGAYDLVLGIPCRPKSVEDLKILVEAAKPLPFVVKGVLSEEDALACIEAGVSGIVVSHHHGILKSAVPPLYILPEIREAVQDRLKIFIDCGFTNGVDAYKALALGADAVSIGRAIMEPIRSLGREGCKEELQKITRELASTMARCGHHRLEDVDDSCIIRL